jgi:hypothetical protein
MTCFRHRRALILFEIFAAFLLASIAGARGLDAHSIRSLIVAAAIALYGCWRAVMLFCRNPALAYGEKGVRAGRLFKVCDYTWSQARDIREVHWKRPYIPYLNWLPKTRDYIELLIQDAGVETGSLKIRADMIELPPGGVKQIIQGFRAAQVAALGERGAARARLGAMEADEAVAPSSALQAERWQRLGIGAESEEDMTAEIPVERPAPVPQAYVPPRPVFGRKIS